MHAHTRTRFIKQHIHATRSHEELIRLSSIMSVFCIVGHTKIFIRSPKTLFELQALRTKFLQGAAKGIPSTEVMVYADRVIGYDQEARTECLFVLTSQAARLMKGTHPHHA